MGRCAARVAAFVSLAWGVGSDPALAQTGEVARAERILEAAREVRGDVEAIRGRRFKGEVQMQVRSRAELKAELEARLFDGVDEAGKAQTACVEARLRLLGLLPRGASYRDVATEVLLDQVGAYYDSGAETFYLMAEAMDHGHELNRMMMAHELCHALDDQYFDLDRLLGTSGGVRLSEDERLAATSVLEGSATALMNVWMARAVREGRVLPADLRDASRRQLDRAGTILEAPRYFTLLVGHYMLGVHFLTRGQGQGNLLSAPKPDHGGAIREVARRMPSSTEQILHPEKYWDPERWEPPILIANDDEVAAAAAGLMGGMHVVERETLGEMVMAVVTSNPKHRLNLTLMARPDYWTNRAATGWGGDRFYLLAEDAARVDGAGTAAVWVSAWDTAADARQFAVDVLRYREGPGWRVALRGRVVVVGLGGAAAHSEEALAGVAARARFTQDGRVLRL